VKPIFGSSWELNKGGKGIAMAKEMTLNTLRKHLTLAKESLSYLKDDIFRSEAISAIENKEEYIFSYKRAERLGLRAINRRIDDLEWMPIKFNPVIERADECREQIKKWLSEESAAQPSAENFGNDFIHALARHGIHYGWDDEKFIAAASKIANIFRDIACMLGVIHYCSWLDARDIDIVTLSQPDNLQATAREMADYMNSSALATLLYEKERDRKKLEAEERDALPKPTKMRDKLRLIVTKDFTGDPPLATV
jgi:hypothetical protein